MPSPSIPASEDAGNSTEISWNDVVKRRSPMKIKEAIGLSKESTMKVKAARAIAARPSFVPKKVVFHIDNLHPSVTRANIEAHLKDIDVGVISLNRCQSWMSSNKSRKVSEVLAIRACILKKDAARFVNPNNWAVGVIVRPWKFQTKTESPGF